MARPKTKDELLAQSQQNFDQLMAQIDPLTPAEREQPGVNGEWAVKDVLAHLMAWHHMFFTWYEAGTRGERVPMPAPGFTWKTTPELNEQIYQQHKDQPYDTILTGLQDSHARIMGIIKSHTDEELFTKKRYKWTGSTSMGSYAVSATSSHYQWAFDLIKKWLKSKASG